MQIKARLAHVKQVAKGPQLSYGCAFTTVRESRIGTVLMEYAYYIPGPYPTTGKSLLGGPAAP